MKPETRIKGKAPSSEMGKKIDLATTIDSLRKRMQPDSGAYRSLTELLMQIPRADRRTIKEIEKQVRTIKEASGGKRSAA